jgi:hypothetical protein
MKIKSAAMIVTLAASSAIAGQNGASHTQFYDVCDVQLHDAYGRVAAQNQHTVIAGVSRTPEQSMQAAPATVPKEVEDAQD